MVWISPSSAMSTRLTQMILTPCAQRGGWLFFLCPGQGCVAAKSGQTPDVALSSTESETIWACSAATQGAYMKQLLDETRIFNKVTFELHEVSAGDQCTETKCIAK